MKQRIRKMRKWFWTLLHRTAIQVNYLGDKARLYILFKKLLPVLKEITAEEEAAEEEKPTKYIYQIK